MLSGLTSRQDEFRREVRAFAAETVTPELLRRTHGRPEEHVAEFYAQLAARGWIGMQWPESYGGKGRSQVDMAIFYEEMGYARAPLGRYTGSVVFVGGSLIAYGGDEQCLRYLPDITAGRLLGAWALTEPDAGSDAASIRTRADTDGDLFVVNGEKIFISGAELADYILTAVRTSPGAEDRHDGLSLILIPANAPGVEIGSIETLAGFNVGLVRFTDAQVGVGQLVGEKGNGWAHINTTLNLERASAAAFGIGYQLRALRELVALIREGSRTDEIGHSGLEPLYAARRKVEAARLASYRVALAYEAGQFSASDASIVKVMESEAGLALAEAGLAILGEQGLLAEDAGVLQGTFEYLYRQCQFRITAGGTNDIQRNIIANHSLRLPHR